MRERVQVISTDGALDEDDGKLGEQRLMDLDFKLKPPAFDARRFGHWQTSTHLHLAKKYAPPSGLGQRKE